MTRDDSRRDPLRFVDDAVKERWPQAFKERPYLAAVEYKVSLMGAAMILVALGVFMVGFMFADPWRALALAMLAVVAFRAAKPLIRARLYDMEEAKRASANSGQKTEITQKNQ